MYEALKVADFTPRVSIGAGKYHFTPRVSIGAGKYQSCRTSFQLFHANILK
jgi:hypothetical protein